MKKDEDVSLYKPGKDVFQVLHNIVNAWNRDKDYKKRWGINPKEEFYVNIKTQGDFLELRVEGLRGGWRHQIADVTEMNSYLKEVTEHLKKAESDLRSEFKKVTGKSFRWSKGKVWSNYEPIAMNSVYRFFASKAGPINVTLEGQKFSEDGPELNKGKIDKEDSWRLDDLLTLPEKWR